MFIIKTKSVAIVYTEGETIRKSDKSFKLKQALIVAAYEIFCNDFIEIAKFHIGLIESVHEIMLIKGSSIQRFCIIFVHLHFAFCILHILHSMIVKFNFNDSMTWHRILSRLIGHSSIVSWNTGVHALKAWGINLEGAGSLLSQYSVHYIKAAVYSSNYAESNGGAKLQLKGK